MADIAQLNRALSCPRTPTHPRYPRNAYRLLNECWATVLYRYLPDTYVVGLLEDYQFANHNLYLTADDCVVYCLPETEVNQPHNASDLSMLTTDEIEGFVKTLEGSRYDFASQRQGQFGSRTQHDIVAGDLVAANEAKSLCGVWLDKEFEGLSAWIWELSAVEGDKRDKHWPPLHVKTQSDLLAHSRKRQDIGWLNPGTSPDKLRSFALAALAEHFRRKLDERTDNTFVEERVEDFLAAWSEVSEKGNFRLGITHRKTMGMSNGKECRNMVYDFDPSAMQFHCFPVLSFPSVRDTFTEGQLEF